MTLYCSVFMEFPSTRPGNKAVVEARVEEELLIKSFPKIRGLELFAGEYYYPLVIVTLTV